MSPKHLSRQKFFGMIALSMGMITREQLDESLAIQQESTVVRRLGSIMLARGYLTQGQIREVLSIQGKTAQTTSLPGTKSERRRLLGEILIERGHIDRRALTGALRRQQLLRRNGLNPRLGELLIAAGKINRDQLKEALVTQSSA